MLLSQVMHHGINTVADMNAVLSNHTAGFAHNLNSAGQLGGVDDSSVQMATLSYEPVDLLMQHDTGMNNVLVSDIQLQHVFNQQVSNQQVNN